MRLLLTSVLILWAAPLCAADPFPVSDGIASAPDVAALSDSSAVAVYHSAGRVYFKLLPDGTESPLAPPGPASESAPAVSAVPGGGFVAAWLSDDGLEKKALLRFFDPTGNPSTDEFPAGGDVVAEDVDVAARPGGGCVVTLAGFGPPGLANVLARIHDGAGQSVSPVYAVSEDQGVYNIHPRVVVASDGGFTITWGAFLRPDSAARARHHSGTGDAWDDPWQVAANAANPTIAIDGEDRWLMAWTSTLGKGDIRGLREGSAEISLGGSGAGIVALAMHSSGSAVAAWHEDDSEGTGLLRARFLDREGQPLGEALAIAAGTEDADGIPAVSVGPGGRVIFTWVDGVTGKAMGAWWDDPLVPGTADNWGSLKSLWR